ncbi:MAG: porin family protein [Candidatus Cryptobacteroides sp.]|nr:porin family protein [Bacteroidales bacterium]MDY5744084.1 porin family protein [Candidatus Cryptobacteroides sp.]
MEDNRFDLEIRSMLENAREDVPEGLWQGIESRLPAPAKARPAAIWWKIASATGAVAAAVALTVFFSTRPVVQNPVDIIPSQDSGLSQLMETPLAPETGNMKPLSIGQVLGESVSETDGKTFTETSGESVVEENAAAGTAGKEETAPAAGTEETAVADETAVREENTAENWIRKYESADFDESGGELQGSRKEKRGVVLSAYADALSNSNTAKAAGSNMLKRPAVPQATTIEETGESRYAIPVAAGIGLRFDVSKRFSIGTGVSWSYLTRSFSGQFNELDAEGAIISQTGYTNIRNSQHYIGIPLNLYVDIIRKDFIDFYAYASGSANYCLSNRYQMDKSKSYSPEGSNWQFSAGIGMGVEFIAAKKVGFYIDPSLNYWFTAGEVSNIRTRQPLMLGLELGIRLHI